LAKARNCAGAGSPASPGLVRRRRNSLIGNFAEIQIE
jgi:hypothetical protein